MNSFISGIQTLIDFRRTLGQPIDHHFLPGCDRTMLQTELKKYSFYFPEPFIDLYTWHNGTRNEDFLIFRDMAWLSFDYAVAEYEAMLQYFWSVFDASEIGLESAQMFPFAGFNGCYLYLTYPGQKFCSTAELPIIGIGDGCIDPYFTSFDSMLRTVEAWFSVGQHNEYSCEVEENLEREIWRRYNPEVFQG